MSHHRIFGTQAKFSHPTHTQGFWFFIVTDFFPRGGGGPGFPHEGEGLTYTFPPRRGRLHSEEAGFNWNWEVEVAATREGDEVTHEGGG